MKRYRVTFNAPLPYIAIDVFVYADSKDEATNLAMKTVDEMYHHVYTVESY